MPLRSSVAWILATVAVFQFFLWRHTLSLNAPPPANIAWVLDASDSSQRDCASDAKMLLAVLRSPIVGLGSTLSVLRTGDTKTDNEPRIVFSGAIPIRRTGPLGSPAKARRAQDALVEDVRRACNGVPHTRQSPILKAVRRALAQLKESGCVREANCLLIVHSDLQDTDELSPRHARLALPIDNAGIRVVICGFSNSISDGAAVNADRLVAAWRKRFVEPVTIAPFCSKELL